MNGLQERLLREAVAAGDDGVYLPITVGGSFLALIASGHAEVRDVRRSGGSRGPRDPRPCEWTDSYLVATDLGKAYIAARQRR